MFVRADQYTSSFSDTVLIELSDILESILITQYFDHRMRAVDDNFLGERGHEWATVFLDMLSRKITKLYIYNPSYSKFLSVRCMDRLKKVYFIAMKIL